MIRHVGILCLFLLVTWPASGSAQTGSVTGSVVDQTGLVLSGTTVTLRGDGVPRTVYSDERGDFELSGGIAPGTYTLTVSLTGFSDATVNDVVVSDGVVVLPEVVLQLASFGDTVVVTASRNEVRLIDAPVSMSVISTATLETTPAQNYGDLLRATPGVNVIQLSARDVQVTSRSPGNTLTNSQLVLVDGRSVYLDFFGLVLWDLLPTNFDDVEQIEVVRGPASAVWGANAMTGAVNIITKPPRESVGTTVTLSGGHVDRNDGSGVGLGEGSMFGANATVTRAPSDRLSYRVSGGYFRSDAFARPTGRIPVIDDPRQPGQTVGGAFYPLDSGTAAFGTGFAKVAGVGGLLAAVVLESVQEINAHPLPVDITIRERPMELCVVRKSVRVSLPGEPDSQGLKRTNGIDLVSEVREYLPVPTSLLAADRAPKHVALDQLDGLRERTGLQRPVHIVTLE